MFRRSATLLACFAVLAASFALPATSAFAHHKEGHEGNGPDHTPGEPQGPKDGKGPKPVTVRAGYGQADATWHVGAAAGQYTADEPNFQRALEGEDYDPHMHGLKDRRSYGVHSRLTYRAIVVQDSEGDQVAFVKSDNYLAQDYLARRVGQILAENGSSVSYDEIFHMASHNHSSPYYTTPSWGVWVFQDVFDLRAFEHHARAMASAILEAEGSMVPARMGATTVTHQIYKGMIQRPGLADDGTPIGYPHDFGDLGLVVIRFDDMTDPDSPQPLATMINWGQHPESLDGYDLITADFLAPLERFVERATGAPLVFGQGDVGSAEAGPGRPELVPDGIPKRWSHFGHANTERGAWFLAQDVVKGWNQIDSEEAQVPFDPSFDVAAGNAFIAGPVSHPYPSVSNCRSHTTAEGNPGAPVLGLPDCRRMQDRGSYHDETLPVWENLEVHGFRLPEHYDFPGFTGVEENLRLKLQAFKMGEVVLASCACEAQVDLILNFESRADKVQENIWDGYDWRETLGCAQNDDTSWTCDHPANRSLDITFSNAAYERMVAQIHNDAAGWDAPENAVAAQAEPSDPSKIWGNFTKEELSEDVGYTLPVGVGHAGDYNGYTVSYREYMTYDDYRKALTSYGPHTADYMSTRLVRLAASLNGAPELAAEINDAQAVADEARQESMAIALGKVSSSAYDAWVDALPNDIGPAEALAEPSNIKRFDGATFSWRGGSNAVDNPDVVVERFTENGWETFAGQSGEVQTMVEFPSGANAMTDTYSGNQEWIWTANFEAFNALPAEIGSTPAGTYRFVVNGDIRQGDETIPYELVSATFEVRPWDGVQVSDLQVGPNGSVSAKVTSDYPDTYESPFPYIRTEMEKDNLGINYCITCSFRPWAFEAGIASVIFTVERADGTVETFSGRLEGGRWVADVALQEGDRVYVAPGDAVDAYGETNA